MAENGSIVDNNTICFVEFSFGGSKGTVEEIGSSD
jgi:hypothetical protein